MTILETHSEALESSNTVYHEFLLYYKAKEKIVYGLVEGKEDPAFYRGMIENSLHQGWTVKLVRAGSRNNVIRLWADMDWARFPAKRICFFIDRDLSEFLNDAIQHSENLYITDNYSIDNEVVNCYTFERVLEEILNVTGLLPGEMDRIQVLFEKNLALFRDAMVPIMVQIVLWKRDGNSPCLDNVQPRDLFSFVDGKLSVKLQFNTPASRVEYAGNRCTLKCSEREAIADSEREFRAKGGAEKYIRGKYLLWFFVKCALSIHQSISVYCPRYPKPPKVRISLGQANAFAVIGPRVRIPDSIRTFIEVNYLQYIQEYEGAH